MSGVWSTGIFYASRNRNTIFLLFHLCVARKKYNRIKNWNACFTFLIHVYIFISLIKLGVSFVLVCIWQFVFIVLSFSKPCIFSSRTRSNERHCFTSVFHWLLQRCCFLSFSFFLVIPHSFCEGHRLEYAKSLKMLVTKGVLENTSLDNGRIEVHPMNPGGTFAI